MEWLVLTLGVVLGLGGLGLGAWGLFGDRPRGRRRRCPACWYRMDGVRGRSCPECGRTARSERALLRTRRRWGWTAAGVLLVIAGAGLGGWSRWMAEGWRAVPSAALVRMTAIDAQPMRDEILRRLNEGRFTPGQIGTLFGAAARDIDREPAHRSAFAEQLLLPLRWGGSLALQDPETRRAVALAIAPHAAAALRESDDRAVRTRAVYWASVAAPHDVEALHALLAAGPDDDGMRAAVSAVTNLGWAFGGEGTPEMRRVQLPASKWFVERVAAVVAERPATREALLDLAGRLVAGEPPSERLGSPSGATVLGLALRYRLEGPSDTLLREVVRTGASGEWTGSHAIRMLRLFPWREEFRGPLAAGIASEDSDVQAAAWSTLEHFGDDARAMAPDVLAVLGRPEVKADSNALQIALALGVDREALRRATVEKLRVRLRAWQEQRREPIVLEGREMSFGGEAIDWIADLAPGDPEAIEVLRGFVFETEPGLACRTAVAYVRLGGDAAGATRVVLEAQGLLEDDGGLPRSAMLLEWDEMDDAAYDALTEEQIAAYEAEEQRHEATEARIGSGLRSLLAHGLADRDLVAAWLVEGEPRRALRLLRSMYAYAASAPPPEYAIPLLERVAEHPHADVRQYAKECLDAARQMQRMEAQAAGGERPGT